MTDWKTAAGGDGSVLAIGGTGPSFSVGPITRTDIVRYAGAGGDFNPLHHDEPYAQSRGLPGIFAMGMFQAGLLSKVATDWFGLGNIHSFSVRMKAQVWPGETLHLGGSVSDLYEEDGVAYVKAALTATSDDGELKVDGYTIARVDAG